jgi:hypothetical protein
MASVYSAAECRKNAAECERRAGLATDETARSMFGDLARQWRLLAKQADTPRRDGGGNATLISFRAPCRSVYGRVPQYGFYSS